MGSIDNPDKSGRLNNVSQFLNPKSVKNSEGESIERHSIDIETEYLLIRAVGEKPILVMFKWDGDTLKAFLKRKPDDETGEELKAETVSGDFRLSTDDKQEILVIHPQAVSKKEGGTKFLFQLISSYPTSSKSKVSTEVVRMNVPKQGA